jgi:hypothetical protein
MLKLVCLLALLALVLWPTNPSRAKDINVMGAGMHSCGAWTKAHAHRPQFSPDGGMSITGINNEQIVLIDEIGWVSGFLNPRGSRNKLHEEFINSCEHGWGVLKAVRETRPDVLPRAPGDEDSGAIQVHHTIKRIILDEGALIEPPILD